MSTFVLIHGAWHGKWCWQNVVPLLSAAGHKVVAIDLPGLGDDQTAIADVTLSGYGKAVEQAVRAQSEPVVLVGHSMGGIAITQAAEYAPERIAALVYLAAFLPANGEPLVHWARQCEGAELVTQVADDGLTATVDPNVALRAFYADVAPETARDAIRRLRPQALAPFATPVETTPERFGAVPRHYIECLRDRALPVAVQRLMVAAQPCQSVQTLDTSHSPFLSAPEDLARALLNIVA